MNSREKWDAIYTRQPAGGSAAQVLVRYRHLLPASGDALDLAAGAGANALVLANHGLRVSAWDISGVAMAQLQTRARATGLVVDTRIVDLTINQPKPDSFDIIIVSRFLDRKLIPSIKAAVRPGGLVYYETFTTTKVSDGGPKNPDYLLAPGELLALFGGFDVLSYTDERLVGDTSLGLRDVACLVAEKPDRPKRSGEISGW